MMKKVIITSILILSGCQTHTVNTQTYLQDAQKTAQAFMQQLGGILKQQIQSQGVVSAIPFCKQVAPTIANQYSTDVRTVKRVSTKARNRIQGIPDAWEEQALANLTQKVNTKTADAPIEFSQVTTENGEQYYRYAKAITVQGICLQCHGQPKDISTDVNAALDKHYPNDIARGYKVGDLRGAVSIKYKLN
jgi:Protein of unknown function (DUF3365)